MLPRFNIGDQLRVIRNIRNDGTWPGLDTGTLLVRRGSMGVVVDIGTYLQDQIIYSLHFVDIDRIVGCREEEVIAHDAPWQPSRFEFRDRVIARRRFAVRGEVVVEPGTAGEVIKVVRASPDGVLYHINFPGYMLCIPEDSLAPAQAETTQGENTEIAP
ncbi:MAG: nitrogen fixation protein NifZ [Azoarcus sp.]|jgi:nitrogen fixation protein NifZ|nr:nitrogen fixation protein NifZ [Azoarcus sp.]